MAHNSVTCPVCGLEETSPDESPLPPLHEIGEFRCEGCVARVIFGKIAPHIVVEPYVERGFRWTRLRIQDPKTRADLHVLDLDPKLAVSLTKNILSVSVP